MFRDNTIAIIIGKPSGTATTITIIDKITEVTTSCKTTYQLDNEKKLVID